MIDIKRSVSGGIALNRFALLCFFLFIPTAFLINLFLIPGDEPDFSVRKFEYIDIFSNIFPKNFINILIETNFNNYCLQNSFLNQPFFFIDLNQCWSSIDIALAKTYIGLINTLPIWILSIFRVNIFSGWLTRSLIERLNLRLNAITALLIFPTIIYHFCLVSPESFVLTLQTLAFIFKDQFWFAFLLVIASLLVDSGNGFLFILFIAYSILLSFASRMIGLRVMTLIVSIALIIIYNLNISILEFVVNASLVSWEKVDGLVFLHQDGHFFNKYPFFYRPLNTILGLILFTPAANKVILSYAFVFLLVIFYLIYRRFKNYTNKNLVALPALTFLSFIILVECILPAYSNAKYYIYCLFPIFNGLTVEFSKYKILFLILTVSVITIFNLFLNFQH